MKKYIFLGLTSIFLTINLFAQTLNGSAFPSPGSIYAQTLADTTGVQPGNAGMGMTWNFSNLINSGKTQVDSFLLPSATPYGGIFPSAGIAVHEVALPTNYYVYYHDDGSEFQRIGNVQPDTVIYSDPANEFPYPVSYGTNLNDTYYASYMSGGSLVHMRGNVTLNADGTGTVITPDGTYSGVLRITGTRDEHDTIFGSPNILAHLVSTYTDWYQPALYYPVMAILQTKVYYSNGFNISQKSVGYRPGIPEGIGEKNTAYTVEISPNPSSTGIFYFRLSSGSEMIRQLDITDITSRIICSVKGNVNEINLTGSSKGVYFYHLQTTSGERYSGKILID